MQVNHNGELVNVMTKAGFARSLGLTPSAVSRRLHQLEIHLDNGKEYILDTEYNRQLFNTRKKAQRRKEDLTGKFVEARITGKVTEQKGNNVYIDMGAGIVLSFKRKDVTLKKHLNT